MQDTLNSSAAIKAEIARVTLELNKHRQDVALLERLKLAQAEAKRKCDMLDRLTAALSQTLAAEAQAEKDAEYARVKDITVTSGLGSGLATRYIISYKEDVFSYAARAQVWESRQTHGFAALSPYVLNCLLDRYPEAIPTEILRLGNTPREAMDAYLVGLRRGFVTYPA